MNKYLVVFFDRYETEDSINYTVEAEGPFKAIIQAYDRKCGGDALDPDEREEIGADLNLIDDTFSCISGEEEDILVYKL